MCVLQPAPADVETTTTVATPTKADQAHALVSDATHKETQPTNTAHTYSLCILALSTGGISLRCELCSSGVLPSQLLSQGRHHGVLCLCLRPQRSQLLVVVLCRGLHGTVDSGGCVGTDIMSDMPAAQRVHV